MIGDVIDTLEILHQLSIKSLFENIQLKQVAATLSQFKNLICQSYFFRLRNSAPQYMRVHIEKCENEEYRPERGIFDSLHKMTRLTGDVENTIFGQDRKLNSSWFPKHILSFS